MTPDELDAHRDLVPMIQGWEEHLGVKVVRRAHRETTPQEIEFMTAHISCGVRAYAELRLDGWRVQFDGRGTYLSCPTHEAARAVLTAITVWRSANRKYISVSMP